MMRARHIASVLILAGGIVAARAANESVATGLESCFQAARTADAICSKEIDDPAQRLECLQKARAAQLECLEHAMSETPRGTTAPEPPSEQTRSEPPATVVSPKAPETVSPGQPSQTGSSERPAQAPSGENSNNQATIKTTPSEPPDAPGTPTGTIRPDVSPKAVEAERPDETNWVVSETLSPIDYSPLVTAQIRSTSPEKDAPTMLSVGCRKRHTELIVRTNGTWAATRRNELRIEYQINDQPAVGHPWVLSSDGRTATSKDDPVGFLQSLPDGARLKIKVTDRTGSSHEATFQLDGWDAVRRKIGTACKWTQATDKTSSDKR